jgi:UMF1 family MFS transporter
VLVQVLVLPITGAVADRTGRKREMLAGFAFLGALAATALYFVADGRWLLGAVLFVLANICFGAATVVYYSWLPDLASPDERDAVSSRGWAFGYVGGALLLAVHLGLVLGAPSLGLTTGEAVRICLATAGLWWGAFTLFTVSRLRNRPVRDTDAARTGSGFRQLATTLREMRAFPLTLWFLGAYLLFNDGVQTVIALSATYAVEELDLSQSVLTGAILMVQVVAVFGALGLGRVAARYGAKRTVLGCLVAWTVVLVAAYTLQEGAVTQFYALAAVIGLVQGGTQALSRSLFSHLIPAGKEAEYYGFYEISDRGTSWLGPLAFGLTYQLTGSYRYAIVSLVVFFVAGFGCLARLPIRRAVVAAGNIPPERL